MAEKNVLSRIPTQQMPERQGNFLSRMADEAIGAFERYGRRSGAQRDASLALMSQAADPNTDPLTGAGMKALGLAGLVTHPLAFFPTREEWDQRLEAAGNTGRMSRSIGGFLSDLPSLIDPQMAAGGAATVAPAIMAGMMAKTADLNKLKQAEKLAELGHSADDIHDMTGLFKGPDGKWRFEIDDSAAKLNDAALDALPDGMAARLSQVYDHPLLYDAYPDLANMLVSKADQGSHLVHGSPSRIVLGKSDLLEQGTGRKIVPHELQHEVQDIEGFARGGNEAEFTKIPSDIAKDALIMRQLTDQYPRGGKPLIAAFERVTGKPFDTKTFGVASSYSTDQLKAYSDPRTSYLNLAGEIEARNVEQRLDMTAAERAASLPTSTARGAWGLPVSDEDQIVRFRNRIR
jgi:hypothetical protein